MIDWQQLVGFVLAYGGGAVAAIALPYAIWEAVRTEKAYKPPATKERSADAIPPSGAVEWVEDICNAMSAASADSVLQALRDGATRDDARSRRIGELEREAAGRELTEATK